MTNFVEVTGGNKFQRDIAHKTIAFMIKKLMPRMRTLDINLEICDIKSDAVGFAMMGDDTRTFELEVDKKIKLNDFVTTLCHEMIHVKQYARKEINGVDLCWKGRNVPKDTDYWNLPWEKEAYRLQKKYADEIWESDLL
jgi:hypothetical protein